MTHNQIDLLILKHIFTSKTNAIEFSQNANDKLLSPDYWRFSKIIIDYIKTYKEVPTKRVILDKISKGKNESLLAYCSEILNKLDETECRVEEWKHDFENIKARFSEGLIKSLKDGMINEDGKIDVKKNISDIQNTISTIKSLSAEKTYQCKTLKEAIPQFREEYIEKQNNPDFDKGMKSGFKKLDEIIGGFRGSELCVIGGESGSGKSLLLQALGIGLWLGENKIEGHDCTNFLSGGNNVLYFSLEMPFKNCFARTVSSLSTVPTRKLRDAKLDDEEASKLKETIKFINSYPNSYEIVDMARGATPSAIERVYLDRKETTNPKVIIVDYMGLMSADEEDKGQGDDWLVLGKISERLHEISRVHDLLVLSAVQLNRIKQKSDQSEKIGASRIGRSSLILTNCNSMFQINTRQNEKNYPTMDIHTIKNREGTNESFELLKNFACSKIIDYDAPEMSNLEDFSDEIDT